MSKMQLPTKTPSTSSPSPSTSTSTSWPYTPFHTSSAEIHDSASNPVYLAGVNWPGHGKPMIPEGLQHASIATIVTHIKSLGMNVVRLTWATEMVDDIVTLGRDVGLHESFVRALGGNDGERVFREVIRWNPELGGVDGRGVGRLQVFDVVAEELARQEIYVHLDNHISLAGWCCGAHDGNGWFGDIFFPISPWIRGLAYMAHHAAQWRSFISMSLRNEPRDSPANLVAHRTYNWSTWYDHMIRAAAAVHTANPAPLIFIAGLDYDTTLEPITMGTNLHGPRSKKTSKVFDLAQIEFADKIVFELHTYRLDVDGSSGFERDLLKAGYNAMVPEITTGDGHGEGHGNGDKETKRIRNVAPVVMTEFGFPQDGRCHRSIYAQTLKQFLTRIRGGWTYWVLAGSYYERQGKLEYDEGWGMLNKDWSGWRSNRAVDEYFRPMVRGVLGLEDEGAVDDEAD